MLVSVRVHVRLHVRVRVPVWEWEWVCVSMDVHARMHASVCTLKHMYTQPEQEAAAASELGKLSQAQEQRLDMEELEQQSMRQTVSELEGAVSVRTQAWREQHVSSRRRTAKFRKVTSGPCVHMACMCVCVCLLETVASVCAAADAGERVVGRPAPPSAAFCEAQPLASRSGRLRSCRPAAARRPLVLSERGSLSDEDQEAVWYEQKLAAFPDDAALLCGYARFQVVARCARAAALPARVRPAHQLCLGVRLV